MTDINTRITNVSTNKDSTIAATIDGKVWSSIQPVGPLYELVLEWQAAGNTIRPYVEVQTITPDQVNAEKDRRIESGFEFQDHLYQSDASSRENIAGAFQMATQAIIQGALPGNFLWQKLIDYSLDQPFVWITADNQFIPMDAQTVQQFGYAALAFKQQMIFKATALKSLNPIPTDYKDDKYWV